MFSGAITAMITPFRDGRLDETRLKEQVEFQISGGIDGLVPVGTTGESPTLGMDEHVRVLELTVQYARGRVPVIGGAGANSTAEALELHEQAKKVGCNGCLSVNPYYNRPTQEGLYRHFMTLADKVDLPIVLYNIPGRTGVTMSAQTVARLHQHPNVVAMKEATGDVNSASDYLSLCNITILSGDDPLTLPLMSVGAKGVISVVSNILPAEIKRLVQLAQQGNFGDAAAIHHRLYPFTRALFLDGNPVGIKAAMKLAGLDGGELRLPLWEASESTRKTLSDQMMRLGLLK